jgi:tyrosyl-tRNA synthetase
MLKVVSVFIINTFLLQVDVKSKIKKAFCPVKITEGNPCLEYIQQILFPWFGKFEVLRNERSGGNR